MTRGRKCKTKADLFGKISGIAQYRPGDPSVKKLGVGISSGTTKELPTFVIHDRADGPTGTGFLEKLHAYGTACTVLCLTHSDQITHRLITEVWRVQQPKYFMSITKHDIDRPAFPSLLIEYSPTQLDAPVSFLVYMLSSLQQREAGRALAQLRERVTVILTWGEKMTPAQHVLISKLLPHATVYSDYSLTELPWWFASTCTVHPDPDTSVHCVAPHFTEAVTIHEPDAAGVGEIVVYTKELGHYRTGDMGKIEMQECDCGSRKKLTVYGRFNYDIVPCVGATFLISEVDRVFGEISAYVDDFLLEVTEEVGADNTVRGKVHASIVPTEALRAEGAPAVTVRDAFETRLFVTPTRTLRELIEENVFLPSDITLIDEIPRRNKKIRLRRR